MSATPWSKFHLRWARLKPPLRANAEVCVALRDLLAGQRDRALLLGVTPELSGIGHDTVAVDRSDKMIAYIWPGNTETRRAVNANWLRLPLAAQSFSAALGDGSLNCIRYPSECASVYRELARVLRPGGRIAVRMYLTPEPGDSMSDVRSDTLAGRVDNIHELKWRLANAIAAERGDPNVSVQHIHDAFSRLFPDRNALSEAAGWTQEEIEQIDAYNGLPDVFNFPTPRQVLALIPDAFTNGRLVPAGTYPLAERCPILVMDRKT